MCLMKNTSLIFRISFLILLATAIFVLDYNTELGVAGGVPYVLLTLVSYWFKKPFIPLLLAGISTLLIFIGMSISPDGGEFWKILVNRSYAAIAVWAVGLSLFSQLSSRNSLNTQKEKFKKQSLELEQQLETLNAAAIVSITNRNGDIIFANDLFCEISKYQREELLGKNHRILKSGNQPQGIFKGMWTAISRGKIWKGELCNKAKDGSFYWVATTIVPFVDKTGEIEKYVSVRFDITRQKSQALELEEKAKEMEKQSAQLLESNKKLANANKELQSFSYSVSHDLKAPLRALQGFSKNLHEKYGEKFDETGNRWLNFIRSNAERMDQLIGDILAFSRVGRKEMNKQEVNMVEMVKEACENIKKGFTGNKIDLEIGDLPKAKIDKSAFELLWYNLLDNAFKYSSTRDVIKVHISGWEKDGQLFYSVTDNGVGFDMKYYDKVFGLFQRLHSDDEFKGTGIGLANVKRILDKHEGKIEAESKKGKGTTIKFNIPKL